MAKIAASIGKAEAVTSIGNDYAAQQGLLFVEVF